MGEFELIRNFFAAAPCAQRGEGVALVAAAAFERDGGGGLTAAEVLEFGVRKGGDDAGDEGNPRRAPVEEDEDQPEIPDGFHVMLG